MSISKSLGSICKDLRMLGDHELARKALLAYAAMTDTKDPGVDLSYSYLMRELRKGDKKRRIKFQKAFKDAFDRALYADLDEPQNIALMSAMQAIDYKKDKDA